MKLPSLWSGSRGVSNWPSRQAPWMDPFGSVRREMENMLGAFDRALPTFAAGAGLPSLNVSEDRDAVEVSVELPGVDQKDLHVSVEDNQLVISGEKKAETKTEEKNWHVEERSYGSFYRSVALPFRPDEGAVDAWMDKGVLHLKVKKPAQAAQGAKPIEIRPQAPQQQQSGATQQPTGAGSGQKDGDGHPRAAE